VLDRQTTIDQIIMFHCCRDKKSNAVITTGLVNRSLFLFAALVRPLYEENIIEAFDGGQDQSTNNLTFAAMHVSGHQKK
jgi:hypothetical protein